jgi:hypothetical protein
MSTAGTYTVDVWHCLEDDRPIHKGDWRRYSIAADNATEASLVACQMAYRFGHAMEATVIDWPDE